MHGAIFQGISQVPGLNSASPAKFKPRQEELFTPASRYTDDTVMTIATKYAVLTHSSYAKAYGLFGRRYKKVGYGPMLLGMAGPPQ